MEDHHCELSDDNLIHDPITDNVIEPSRLITLKEGNRYYCFDIDTLYREVQAGRRKNPYTRVDLSPDILARIEEYGRSIQLIFEPILYDGTFSIDSGTTVGVVAASLLNKSPTENTQIYFNAIPVTRYDLSKSMAQYFGRNAPWVLVNVNSDESEELRSYLVEYAKKAVYQKSSEHQLEVITNEGRTIMGWNDVLNNPDVTPANLNTYNQYLMDYTMTIPVYFQGVRPNIILDRYSSLFDLLLMMIREFPNKIEDATFFDLTYNGTSLYGYDLDQTLENLFSTDRNPIIIVPDSDPLRQVHRAQKIYDGSIRRAHFGLADYITDNYPEVVPVHEELYPAALEQQRRIQSSG